MHRTQLTAFRSPFTMAFEREYIRDSQGQFAPVYGGKTDENGNLAGGSLDDVDAFEEAVSGGGSSILYTEPPDGGEGETYEFHGSGDGDAVDIETYAMDANGDTNYIGNITRTDSDTGTTYSAIDTLGNPISETLSPLNAAQDLQNEAQG